MQKLDSLTSPEYFGWQILIKMSFFFVLVSVLFASEVEAEVLNSNFSTQRSHWDLLVARDEHFAGRASEVGRTQAFLEFLAPVLGFPVPLLVFPVPVPSLFSGCHT